MKTNRNISVGQLVVYNRMRHRVVCGVPSGGPYELVTLNWIALPVPIKEVKLYNEKLHSQCEEATKPIFK